MRTRNTEQKLKLLAGILFALSLGLIAGSIPARSKGMLPVQRDVVRLLTCPLGSSRNGLFGIYLESVQFHAFHKGGSSSGRRS